MSAPYESVRGTVPSLIEQREQAWKNVEVLCLETHDQHFSEGPVSPEDVYQTIIVAKRCLRQLRDHAQAFEKQGFLERGQGKKLELVENLIHQLDFQERMLLLGEATRTTPSTLSEELSKRYSKGAFSILEGDQKSTLDVTELSKHFKESPRSHLLSLSDSHRTTADVFRSLQIAQWKYEPSRTALLSFDHHTDTYDLPTQDPEKANVMRWLLERNHIGALGVIGTQPVYYEDRLAKATFIEGSKLYDRSGTPKRAQLDASLDNLFWRWHTSGIKSLYLSVDLDGLRLDELGITATDYSRERAYWTGLKRLAQAERFILDPNLPHELIQKLWSSVRFALDNLERRDRPYHGIPASWIIHTLRLAKAVPYEFEIGIKDRMSGRTVIGDITEVSGLDRRRHGARITSALLNAIVKETAD